MRPGCVVVAQVLGQHLVQMVLIDDQGAVEDLAAQGADDSLADGVRFGRLRRAGQNPDAAPRKTASKPVVNWPARSLIRNLTPVVRGPGSIRKLRAAWVVHAPSGFALTATGQYEQSVEEAALRSGGRGHFLRLFGVAAHGVPR